MYDKVCRVVCPWVGPTKTQYAPQVHTTRATYHTQLIILGFFTRISLFLEDYVKLMKIL